MYKYLLIHALVSSVLSPLLFILTWLIMKMKVKSKHNEAVKVLGGGESLT